MNVLMLKEKSQHQENQEKRRKKVKQAAVAPQQQRHLRSLQAAVVARWQVKPMCHCTLH